MSPAATCRASSAAAFRAAPMRSLPVIQNPPMPSREQAWLLVRSCALHAAIMSPSFRWELAKMTNNSIRRQARLGTALAALALGLGSVAASAPASAQRPAGTYRPSQQVLLSLGEGQLVRLPSSAADVWTSNPEVADVYVSNPKQINLFGKSAGEATVIATGANGSVVYSANVRVSQNLTSVDELLRAA